MKRIAKIVGGILLIGLAIFLLGPRPDTAVELTFNSDDIGIDMDAYLAKSEEGIANLIPGTEKEIIWNDSFTRERTPLSIVYIHGFSATKHETRPVPDNIAKALGANLYFARMTGHGRDGEGLAEATAQDWVNDFAEAIAIGERLGRKVVVIATSNGAAISTWGLSNPQLTQNVAAAIYMSPNFELQGISTWMANIPWAETLLPMLGGDTQHWDPENELHGKWWTNTYPTSALTPMTSLLKVVKNIDKSEIKTPTMFVFSPDDTVVVPEEIRKAESQWGGETRVMEITEVSNPSNHVIAGDILAPENNAPITDAAVAWIQETIQ